MRRILAMFILALLAGAAGLATGVIGGGDYLHALGPDSVIQGVQWSMDRGGQGLSYLNRYLTDNLSDEVFQANQALMDLGQKAFFAAREMAAQGEAAVRKALNRDLVSGLSLPEWPSWSLPTWTDMSWPDINWPAVSWPNLP